MSEIVSVEKKKKQDLTKKLLLSNYLSITHNTSLLHIIPLEML